MKLFVMLALLLSFTNSTYSQSTFDRSNYMKFEDKFFGNYFVTPTNSEDSLDFTVTFKISHSALAFNKVSETARERIFAAEPIVEVVFYDSDGIIRDRELWSDTVFVNNFEETNNRLLYTGNFISARLKKSDYKIKISLLDKYNQKIKDYQFLTKNNFSDELNYSKPFFTHKVDNIESPLIFNSDIEFSSNTAYVNFLVYDIKQGFNITVQKLDSKNDEVNYWDNEINYTAQVELTDEIPLLEMQGRLPVIKYKQNQSNKYKYARAEIPAYEFVPGKYKITIGDPSDSVYYLFSVKWFNKPHSLKDVDFALESMQYILTEDEEDRINEGDEEEVFNNIIKYWAVKDPTPATPYNEAMAEYFRRVDYATLNYRTIKEKNGMKTDRGKIYILFGSPTTVNSELKEDSSYEIWDYKNRVNKTFTFEMVSAGIYRLIEVKDKSEG